VRVAIIRVESAGVAIVAGLIRVLAGATVTGPVMPGGIVVLACFEITIIRVGAAFV
jgi:hypothetical protein